MKKWGRKEKATREAPPMETKTGNTEKKKNGIIGNKTAAF